MLFIVFSCNFTAIAVSYTHLDVYKRQISQMALDRCAVANRRDWNSLKSAIKGDVSDYLFKKTKRIPMVLPIIMEI